MNIDQFPSLSAAVPPRRRDALAQAIEIVSKGVIDNQIPNVRYIEAKTAISNAMESAWRNAISERFTYAGKFRDLSPEEQELETSISAPQPHTVASAQKKIAKSKIDPSKSDIVKAMIEFLDEVEPLASALVSLKDKVVKKAPKSVADANDKYSPAPATTDANKIVQDALETVTRESYEGIKAKIEDNMRKIVEEYLDMCAKAEAEGKTLASYTVYNDKRSKTFDQDKYEVVTMCVEDGEKWASGKLIPAAKKSDCEDRIVATAKKRADEIRDAFIFKNLKKLASIIDAKGDFEKIEIVGSKFSMSGVEGRFKVTFKDGASFVAQNSVVVARSVHGKLFLRFPLTFHNVFISPGKRMPLPSEEKMNTVFAKKPNAETVAAIKEAREIKRSR